MSIRQTTVCDHCHTESAEARPHGWVSVHPSFYTVYGSDGETFRFGGHYCSAECAAKSFEANVLARVVLVKAYAP